MIRRTAGYLTALLVVAYLFFMYDAPALSGILVLFLLYPGLSAVYLALAGKKVRPDMSRVPPVGEPGKPIKAGITVKNTSKNMSLRYELKLAVGNKGEKKRKKQRVRGILAPSREETLWCLFQAERCAVVEVCLVSVNVYDFFGIFYRKTRWNKKAKVKVMPEFNRMPLEITRRTREFQADAQEFSQLRRGDDPSEIYQVREYTGQDSMKDIHWKLSAREETLMVKERSFPLGCVVLIYIDYREGDSKSGFSNLLETAASLSITLAEEKCIHMAAWYEEKNERIVGWRVFDAQSACNMIWNLMDAEPCKDVEKAEICYADTFRGVEFAAVVTIDGKGRMKKDGEPFEYLRL